MIDIEHTNGCGKVAFAVSGVPVGRELEFQDVIYPGRGPAWIFGDQALCGECGGVVNIEAIRAQVGRADGDGPEIVAVPYVVPDGFKLSDPNEPTPRVKTLEELMGDGNGDS